MKELTSENKSENPVEKRIKKAAKEGLEKLQARREHSAGVIWQQIEDANAKSTMKPYKPRKEG
jgi:hypothetical protein